MASPLLGNIEGDVTKATTVVKSATVLIEGFQSRLDAGVEAALAKGATEAQLKPLSDLSDALEADSDKLAVAVAANTPSAPPVPPAPPA